MFFLISGDYCTWKHSRQEGEFMSDPFYDESDSEYYYDEPPEDSYEDDDNDED